MVKRYFSLKILFFFFFFFFFAACMRMCWVGYYWRQAVKNTISKHEEERVFDGMYCEKVNEAYCQCDGKLAINLLRRLLDDMKEKQFWPTWKICHWSSQDLPTPKHGISFDATIWAKLNRRAVKKLHWICICTTILQNFCSH